MNASELFQAGKLQAAIDAQLQVVKANPADPSRRLFLFELAAFAGDLDRAKRQIEAVQYGEMERDAAVAAYRKLIDAEDKRRRLFRDGLAPRFLAAVPEQAQRRLEAVNRLREGRQTEAAALLAGANEQAETLEGTFQGKPFRGFRDADDLFGTVLEVMAHGEYFWVPAEQIDSLALNPPRFPRDLIWMPARLMLKEGENGEVFLPVLYPQSHEHPDDQVRLGRSTDWKQAEGGPVRGVGARTFLVGEDGVALAEWRELTFA
jgi:type VI secretion system protein ImpE